MCLLHCDGDGDEDGPGGGDADDADDGTTSCHVLVKIQQGSID